MWGPAGQGREGGRVEGNVIKERVLKYKGKTTTTAIIKTNNIIYVMCVVCIVLFYTTPKMISGSIRTLDHWITRKTMENQ